MSIFPFVSNIEEIKINNSFPLYKEIAWDFKKNIPIIENREFKIVKGNEAIRVWCYKAILTSRYEFPIYSWDYGSEVMSLIGKNYTPSLTQVELKRYIEETLMINPYILDVNVLDTDFKDGILSANIKITTIYGESEVVI